MRRRRRQVRIVGAMTDTASKTLRRTVHFTGRVQGVFFRATTCSVASSFQVTGLVRNLPDGRVELVAEGTKTELDRFQAAVLNAMRSNISTVDASDDMPTGEFASFPIAY